MGEWADYWEPKVVFPCGHPFSWLFAKCPVCLHKELSPDKVIGEGASVSHDPEED